MLQNGNDLTMSFTLPPLSLFSLSRPYVYIFVCLKNKKETRVPVFFVTFATGKKLRCQKKEKGKKTSFVISSPFSSSMRKRNISFQSCFWRCRLTLPCQQSKAKQSKATICRSIFKGEFQVEGGYQR